MALAGRMKVVRWLVGLVLAGGTSGAGWGQTPDTPQPQTAAAAAAEAVSAFGLLQGLVAFSRSPGALSAAACAAGQSEQHAADWAAAARGQADAVDGRRGGPGAREQSRPGDCALHPEHRRHRRVAGQIGSQHDPRHPARGGAEHARGRGGGPGRTDRVGSRGDQSRFGGSGSGHQRVDRSTPKALVRSLPVSIRF